MASLATRGRLRTRSSEREPENPFSASRDIETGLVGLLQLWSGLMLVPREEAQAATSMECATPRVKQSQMTQRPLI